MVSRQTKISIKRQCKVEIPGSWRPGPLDMFLYKYIWTGQAQHRTFQPKAYDLDPLPRPCLSFLGLELGAACKGHGKNLGPNFLSPEGWGQSQGLFTQSLTPRVIMEELAWPTPPTHHRGRSKTLNRSPSVRTGFYK